MGQVTKKEPPEPAARSAKQGGVKVQKMVGRPINDRETLTRCQPAWTFRPRRPLRSPSRRSEKSWAARCRQGGSRAGRLLRFPIR